MVHSRLTTSEARAHCRSTYVRIALGEKCIAAHTGRRGVGRHGSAPGDCAGCRRRTGTRRVCVAAARRSRAQV
eukprot:893734-Pleurochrysis_carterae.AAC.1